MKFNKEYSLGALLILIVIMVIKPDLLGLLYNNMLGKLIFIAAIVFLTLKHTVAGLIAVVFVALVASMTGYTSFEGMTEGAEPHTHENKEKKECPDGKCAEKDTSTVSEGVKSQHSDGDKKKEEDKVDIASLLKSIK
jgi:MFS superfamily sulfate permease-like transporter